MNRERRKVGRGQEAVESATSRLRPSRHSAKMVVEPTLGFLQQGASPTVQPSSTPIAAVALKHRTQVQRSRAIEPIDTDDRDDDHGEMPFAIDIVSGRSFGWNGDRGPGRQRMLEESAGMRSTARPSRSLFRTIGVYGRLALKTDLKSGVRIVTEQRNPRLVMYLFDFRRTYVGEERDGARSASAPRRMTVRTFGAPSIPEVAS